MSGAFGFGKSKSSSKPKDIQAKEFKELRDPFAKQLQSLIGGGPGGQALSGLPQAPAGLTTPAQLGGGEQQALQQLAGAVQPGGLQGQTSEFLGQVMGGQFLPGQAGANPFLQAAIEAAQRPTLQGLEETLSRTLPGRFTQAGQFTQPQGSSPFDRAAGIATRGAADALGDIATNISSQAFQQERGLQQQAATQATQFGAQEIQNLQANLQAQALPRMIEQLGLDRGLEEFQRRNEQLLQILSILGGVTQPTVGQRSKGSSFEFKTQGAAT